MGFQDKIVISGISGRFPESSNLAEWEENLFNGIDMVTDDDRRFVSGLYGLPRRSGKLKELDKFDAVYFGISRKHANMMDPQLRLLLELTHEAIIDAGINPVRIRGTKTGVFVGQSFSETEHSFLDNPDKVNAYVTVGCMKAMFANRISYAFDFKGPSIPMDTACSSSLVALEQAVSAIKAGHCDRAIVCGVNICLNPSLSLAFQKLGVLSQDGTCKTFDATADGYARSEAAVVIFIQKVQKMDPPPRRFYATILHAKTNVDGYKVEGPTFPSGHMQRILLNEIYEEARVDPCQVSYVEAHGTGTKAGDSEELRCISEVFIKNRKINQQPLLIGSVKSNMGHSEAASGLCSIAKVCLAAKHGALPGNLHFKSPNPNISALLDGKLKVVTETTQWPGGIVGVSSFGFGGANVHVILESNPIKKVRQFSSTQGLPLIIPISGRTRSSVEFALTQMDKMDQGLVALLHEISLENIPGHSFKGFTLLEDHNNSPATILEGGAETDKNPPPPPVWFVYSGMGSQCLEIGQSLMAIQIFRESIIRLDHILKSHGFNLLQQKADGDYELRPKLKDGHGHGGGVTHDFVQITAIQLALTDLLNGLGIFPDGIVGHSIGEVACGYADGCLTAGEAILTSFYRGKAIEACQFSEGAMAAVGMTWEEALVQCPPLIFPACHNSGDSVTVSGPQKDVENFVKELESKKIFAKMVDSSGQAFHSPYIKEAGPPLTSWLKKILDPSHWTKRSNRWVSTSSPSSSSSSKISSVDYFVQNLLSPVLFHDALKKIPPTAIVIEIGPHAILAAILKRSLSSSSTLSMVNKNRLKSDPVLSQLCKSVGCLYIHGLNPKWSALYPKMEFPVSMTTNCISPLIQWDHGSSWHVAKFEEKTSTSSSSSSLSQNGEKTLKISLEDPLYEFMKGHQIDGRILIPATGYLVMIWKFFADLQKLPSINQVAVIFEQVQFSRATILPSKGGVTLTISFLESTGEFHIHEGPSLTVKGFVRAKNPNVKMTDLPQFPLNGVQVQQKYLKLNSKDIYKSLQLRGYNYEGLFQGILEADNDCCHGYLKWAANWTSFLDTMLQFSFLNDRESLAVPTLLKFVCLDPTQFLEAFELGEKKVSVCHSKISNLVTCPGIQFRGWQVVQIPRRPPQASQAPPDLDEYKFVLYFDPMGKNFLKKSQALRCCVDIALENMTVVLAAGKTMVSVREVCQNSEEEEEETLLGSLVIQSIQNHPHFDGQLLTLTDFSEIFFENSTTPNQLVIVSNFLNIQNVVDSMQNSTFLLYHGDGGFKVEDFGEKMGLNLICQKIPTDDPPKIFCLWRKQIMRSLCEYEEWKISRKLIFVDQNEPPKKFQWVEELKVAMATSKNSQDRIYLTAQQDHLNGIVGLVNCLRQEPGGSKIRCFFIRKKFQKNHHQTLDSQLIHLFEQDLVMNVYDEDPQSGHVGWGSFRHFSLTDQIKNVTLSTVEHVYLETVTRGDLSSLHWVQAPIIPNRDSDQKSLLCTVFYASIGLENLWMATGKIQSREQIVMEFSGKNHTGQRVMGCPLLKKQKGFGLISTVLIDQKFLWRVPDSWTLFEASTVPLAYSTAYYTLVVEGRMTKGDSILIQYCDLGSNGLGQAFIGVLLSFRISSIFITIGADEEKEFLKNIFPQLQDTNFLFQGTHFEQTVLQHTKGHGVSLVVSGDFLNDPNFDSSHSSLLNCLAEGGKFLQVSTPLETKLKSGFGFDQQKNFSFHKISMDSLLAQDSEKRRQVFDLVDQGIESGVVVPLASEKYSEKNLPKAFQKILEEKSINKKVTMEIRDENEENLEGKKFTAISKLYFSPSKSFIIIGGLGGYGLELANWMIGRGVKKLVLVSRSGVTTGYQHFCLRQWQDLGVQVVTSQVDVGSEEGATELLQKAVTDLGPIGGIFNLAMALSIDLMDKQTPERFAYVTRCKIEATLNLDRVSRELAADLEYFVVFSSVSSGCGIPGQVNYGMGNSVMERICEERRKVGLPALAIQWGAVGDVGAVSEKFGGNNAIVGGSNPQSIRSCLNAFEIFMLIQSTPRQNQIKCSPVLSSMVVARSSSSKNKGDQNFEKNNSETRAVQNQNSQSLTEKVGWILGMSPSDLAAVPPSTELLSLGLDSLMGVEVKQTLERDYGVQLSSEQIKKLTFEMLQMIEKPSQSSQLPSNPQPSSSSEEKIQDPSSSSLAVTESTESMEKILEKEEPKDGEKMSKNSNFFSSLHFLCLYILGLFIIFGLFLLIILSLLMAQLTKIWLKFRFGTKKKLMDRPFDSLFTYNQETSNMVMIVKCQSGDGEGLFDREKFVKNFKKKVLDRLLILSESEGDEFGEPLMTSQPYDCLRWRIDKSNCLFYTWTLQDNFEVENHIIFESSPKDTGLDEAGLEMAEFYLKHSWDDSKPQWEIKVLTTTTPHQNFVLVMALHHSYSDGLSFTQMVEFAMADDDESPPPSSSLPLGGGENRNPPPKFQKQLFSPPKEGEEDPAEIRLKLKTLIVENLKFCLLFPHTLILKAIEKYKDALDCPKPVEPIPSNRTCRCFVGDLRKFRSVKLRHEGEKMSRTVGLTPIVMTCIAQTFRKIYEENGQGEKCPQKLIFWTPYARYEKPLFQMENSFSTAWITTPIITQSKISWQTSLRIVQKNVTLSTEPHLLNVTWLTTAALSMLARPFFFLTELAPRFSLVFSNVVLSTPTQSNFRILGGHRVIKMCGFPPIARGSVGSIGSFVDGDKVILAMAGTDGLMPMDGPLFMNQFFYHFNQQLEAMVECSDNYILQ